MLNVKQYDDVTFAEGACSLLGTTIKVYLYLVDGLLFDTGPFRMRNDIAGFVNGHRVEQVALTHVHDDHAGMAHWLQQHKQVPVYVNPGAMEIARAPSKQRLYRRLMWGRRKPFFPEPMPAKLTTGKYTFEVIDTPGHTPFHRSFWEKDQGWLFTGDLYVSKKVRLAFDDEDMGQLLVSLDKLVQLDFDTVFCAHAGIVPKGKEMLRAKIAFLKELQAKIKELRNQGWTDKEIDRLLFPRDWTMNVVSRGEWSSYHLVHTL